jgi:imidazole glycerol-phosphate synthase subunit HisF
MVKGKAFARHRYLGDPINAVKIFNEKMADELILLDIDATARGRIAFDWIEDVVSEAFMPIAYGGGLTTMEQCAELFSRGVEKVIFNTAAVERPEIIAEVAGRYGSQAVVVSIDAKRNLLGRWKAYVRGGRKQTRFQPAELARACEQLGCGEIFLSSIEREGAFGGYDLDLIRSVSGAVGVPVIAHGGAGKVADFAPAVTQGGASAVAAGSMFVFAGKDQGMLISYPGQAELAAQFWGLTAQ